MPNRILIAEDEQVVALELRHRLSRAGHTVVDVVASGEEVIDSARRLRPDLVLMDIKLQGEMDGIAAANAIRESIDVPIVYLTAFADDATVARAKLTEPYGYVLKPFQERELLVIVEIALYRHRAERALRESEAWRLALLRSVGDGVIAVGNDGAVRFMNPVAEALTGWTESTAIGRPVAEVLRLVSLVERRGALWKDPVSQWLLVKEADRRPVDAKASPIADGAARLGTVWVLRDVADRKRLQDRQRLVSFAGSECSSSLDREALTGRLAALLARNFADWCVVHLVAPGGELAISAFAHRDPSKSAIAQTLIGERLRAEEGGDVRRVAAAGRSLLRPPDAGVWTLRRLGVPEARAPGLAVESAMLVPLVARDRCIGTLTVASEPGGRTVDASDVGFAEEVGRRLAVGLDNAQLYAEAQTALRLRDDVLAIVSHDLRTPLSAIALNAAQLLRAGDRLDKEHVVAIAAVIQRGAKRMDRLIEDLVDVGRIDRGALSLELARCSAASIVSELMSMFEPLAAERAIRLRVDDVPDVDLLCDRGRILQVLSNLIGNALKFSQRDAEVVIRGAVSGPMLRLSVSDQAGGIPSDQIEHVFERHWQAPTAIRKGSGLGLYIARGIVAAHGGRIEVESTPGEGSTFSFTTPLATRVEEAAARE